MATWWTLEDVPHKRRSPAWALAGAATGAPCAYIVAAVPDRLSPFSPKTCLTSPEQSTSSPPGMTMPPACPPPQRYGVPIHACAEARTDEVSGALTSVGGTTTAGG